MRRSRTGRDAPVFAGCVGDAGYTHESQCWVYAGPDTAHVGREICVDSNGPTHKVAIVDVTDKGAPVTLSSFTYDGAAYPHQGWLTDDHRYLLVDDELDESNFGHAARTYVFDVSDLDAPVLVGHHDSALGVIDHNQYVHGQYVYQSNYEAGVRILRMDNLSAAQLTEVAYFDTYPASDHPQFNGSWNNYRFPGSGRVIATGIDEGFFVLEPHLCTAPATPALAATPNGDHRIDLAWSGSAPDATYRVERAQGGCGGRFETIADQIAASSWSDTDASGDVTYGYRVVATDASGGCAAPASTCVEAQTSGSCTAPPLFAGIANAGTAQCRVDLAWAGAQPACGGPAAYSVYRSDQADFVPDLAHRIATGIGALAWADDAVAGGRRSTTSCARATPPMAARKAISSASQRCRPGRITTARSRRAPNPATRCSKPRASARRAARRTRSNMPAGTCPPRARTAGCRVSGRPRRTTSASRS